jgi:hypothetical protein
MMKDGSADLRANLRLHNSGDFVSLLDLPFGPALPVIRDAYDPFGRRVARKRRELGYRRLQRNQPVFS